MGSSVTFIDEKSRAERTVRLVYPAEADIAAGRMSILTPVGAGLIGLSVGQSINWPDRGGIEHRQIGRAHVLTPVTNAHLVCRLLLETKKNHQKSHISCHSRLAP